MAPDLKELLSVLNEHHVEYLVVGGYAIGIHAEPRATKDLDIFIRANTANSEAVFRALAAYGAPLAGYSPADFNDGGSWFQMGQPPHRVDILQHIDDVDFDTAWANRVESLIDGDVPAHVISREDLIRNKLKCGRPRDLLDVDELRRAANISGS
jgi:predicted nucleotidyltransferase